MVYPIGRKIIPPICKLWLRKAEGLENIPKGRAFIIAANHSSYFDTFLPPVLVVPKVDKKIHPLVNSYYWKIFITRFFLELWEAIPVFVDKEKYSKEKNKIAFQKAVNYLKKNELIMIFPEGTRSYDGKLRKAFTGVARLCLEAKAPVLPIGIIDAHRVLPVGKALPRLKRCEAKIGKLMHFDEYYSKKIDKRILREVTNKIMKEIARLSNQEYNYK